MQLLEWVNPLLIGTAVLYIAAGTLFAFRRIRVASIALGAGWAANLAVFIVNALIVRDIPMGNMYQVQVVLALCFPPLLLMFTLRDRLGWTALYFAYGAALPLIGAFFMDKQATWRRMPALHSAWFVPHVLSYMIAYALCAVAFIMLIRLWIGRARRPEYRRAIYRILRTAFPFMTFGMLGGALWAEAAWGRYWSWDAKEVWSLITWGLYAIYFHTRGSPWSKWADLPHLLAFLALLTTFFLVNLLPKLGSLLHSYA
jgi:ABC-type transport system involved in cytochrome c biogenesis permease subunit